MTELVSATLGPLHLQGDAGGGWIDTTVDLHRTAVPFRIEIDHPESFGESIVRVIDIVVSGIQAVEPMARRAISVELERSGSAGEKLFTVWRQSGFQRRDDPDEFLADLSVTQITLLPDGGAYQPDRLILIYRLPDTPPAWKIVVRMKDRIGAEVDPAPRGGFV